MERMDERRRISARRLIEGGPAIFTKVARNHHIDMFGRIVRNPLVKNSLRVFVVSWFIPARENRVGEDSPWASIIANVPFQPHDDREHVPAIASPMWATDE